MRYPSLADQSWTRNAFSPRLVGWNLPSFGRPHTLFYGLFFCTWYHIFPPSTLLDRVCLDCCVIALFLLLSMEPPGYILTLLLAYLYSATYMCYLCSSRCISSALTRCFCTVPAHLWIQRQQLSIVSYTYSTCRLYMGLSYQRWRCGGRNLDVLCLLFGSRSSF